MLEIKVKRLRGVSKLPRYATGDSSGLDLFAAIEKDITIEPLSWEKIPTGIALEIPKGYEGEIRPRSGLSFEHGITILNSPGTIDADYRGEVEVILINLSKKPFVVRPGMRIAQLVIRKVEHVKVVEVEELSRTERGEGGFGHTGYF